MYRMYCSVNRQIFVALDLHEKHILRFHIPQALACMNVSLLHTPMSEEVVPSQSTQLFSFIGAGT
jgi:hypothetical protein